MARRAVGEQDWRDVLAEGDRALRLRTGGALLKDDRAHDEGDQEPTSLKRRRSGNESLTHHWELRHRV